MHIIVAYTFLNICEKIHQFLSSIRLKQMHTKKIGSFFLPHGVEHRCKNVRFLFWSRFYVF